NNLGGHYWQHRRQYDKAEPFYLRAFEDGRRALGVRHPETLRALGSLGQMYVEQRQYAKAEPLYAQAAPVILALLEEDPGGTFGLRPYQAALPLVHLYLGQGELNLLRKKRYAEAEPALRILLRFGLNPWLKPHAKGLLGECLAGQQKDAEAEPLLLASYEDLR